jgi:hypothetical protein
MRSALVSSVRQKLPHWYWMPALSWCDPVMYEMDDCRLKRAGLFDWITSLAVLRPPRSSSCRAAVAYHSGVPRGNSVPGWNFSV